MWARTSSRQLNVNIQSGLRKSHPGFRTALPLGSCSLLVGRGNEGAPDIWSKLYSFCGINISMRWITICWSLYSKTVIMGEDTWKKRKCNIFRLGEKIFTALSIKCNQLKQTQATIRSYKIMHSWVANWLMEKKTRDNTACLWIQTCKGEKLSREAQTSLLTFS